MLGTRAGSETVLLLTLQPADTLTMADKWSHSHCSTQTAACSMQGHWRWRHGGSRHVTDPQHKPSHALFSESDGVNTPSHSLYNFTHGPFWNPLDMNPVGCGHTQDTRTNHGEIIYGGTRRIEDDRSATFSEYIFLFPACLMISHWLTKNAELNSVF